MDSTILDSRGTTPVVASGPVLNGRQMVVYRELAKRERRLGEMYLGAIHALGQASNPECLPQAAHSLRELIEKLGEDLGTAVSVGPTLKDKVRELQKKWPTGPTMSLFDERSGAFGSNKQLLGFLETASAFFEWFDKSDPTRREQIGRFLGAIDPLNRRLLPPIEKTHVERWSKMRDELLRIAHHGRQPTENEFRCLLDALETLLMQRLQPRTFEEQEEIDLIIAEGERRP